MALGLSPQSGERTYLPSSQDLRDPREESMGKEDQDHHENQSVYQDIVFLDRVQGFREDGQQEGPRKPNPRENPSRPPEPW